MRDPVVFGISNWKKRNLSTSAFRRRSSKEGRKDSAAEKRGRTSPSVLPSKGERKKRIRVRRD